MRRRPRVLLVALLVACLAATAALPSAASAKPRPSADEEVDVLVFSRTAGFRHVSIPSAIKAVRELGEEYGFGVEATEDPAQFTWRSLKRFDAVIWLLTTGTVLDEPQKRAFMRYVRRGGGYVGVHSAADTEYDWPFYGRLVGAWFKSHPLEQTAEIVNEARKHPATAHLDPRFEIFDEFYSFRTNPRPDVRVLLSVDESTYDPDPNTSHLPGGPAESGVMGDHPMAWCHDKFRGRAFYTALGHENYLYELDWFRTHLAGGILTATRTVKAGCKPRRVSRMVSDDGSRSIERRVIRRLST